MDDATKSKILEMRANGSTLSEISSGLSLNRDHISIFLRNSDNNLSKYMKLLVSQEIDKFSSDILDLYLNQQKSTRDIASIYKVDKKTVSRFLKKNKIKANTCRFFKVTCILCENEFTAKRKSAKYCSLCKASVDRADARQRYRINHDIPVNIEYGDCVWCKNTFLLKRADNKICSSCKPRSELSDSVKKIVYLRDNYICQYCGQIGHSPENKLHIEHSTPICRGGDNSLQNLKVACSKCNLEKYNKTEEEYREYLKLKGRNIL